MNEPTRGLLAEIEQMVREEDTAVRWGSGLVRVFSTPALVGMMERAAVQALSGHLPPGKTTVGRAMDVHHLAPTPVGMKVRAWAELTEVEGRRYIFKIQVWDEVELIGEAIHERFLIDEARFIEKAAAKLK